VWIEIVNVSRLEKFKGFDKAFSQNVQHYRSYFENANAHAFPLDLEFDTALNAFQKLLIVRCIRPDRFMLGTSGFVAQSLGQRFVEPPAFDLSACYAESSVVSPLVFVLSSGADPMADLAKFAAESKMAKRFDQVSLGQGQGPKATNLIKIAMETGMWVCLQNCHLAESWMPKLDVLVEQIDPDTVHRDFRLWLTSMPSPAFPVAILQNGVKMTLEPPKGLKSNLVRSYQRLSDEYIDESKDPVAHRKLLFSICLFHAVIQDRRKFGPLGWNIPYDFTDGDLSMCQRQIKMMIDDYDVIPFKVIRVLCGEINYGGRVTDDKDRRLINNLLDNFVTENVVGEDYCWSPSGAYQMPMAKNREETVAHIMQMPGVPHPEIFGLHENADITCDQNETYALFETVLSLQPRVVGGAGLSREAVIELAATDIFEKIPEPFDIDVVTHKYPTTYGQSMNTVLTQECIRYSALLEVILDTLKEALKALKGLVVMSPELEQVTDAIFDNRVPEMWTSKAYPSLKPLSSWVIDLLERLTFIDQWIENGPPAVYWISGLFFPQARIFAFPKSEHCLPPLFQRTTRVVCSVASTRGVCSVASTSNTYWHTRGCYKYSRNALFADCPPVHHGLPTVCQSPSTIHPYQDSATDLFRFTIAGISHRDVTKLRAQKRVRHRPSHMELQRGGWKDRGQHP
jgi:dynein heavy chain